MSNQPIIVERTLDAPVDRVWKAISDRDQMSQWYFDLAEFRAEPGFEFQFIGGRKDAEQFVHLCKILEVIPNKKLSYSWDYQGYKGHSVVSFELFPEGDKTRLKLTHEGLESFDINGNPDLDKKNFVGGWDGFINKRLPEYLAK